MRVRRLWLALVICLIPNAAGAHLHKADLYAGAGLSRGSTLGGVQQTIAITFPALTKLSILGDFSVYLGSREDSEVTRLAFMTGFRFTHPLTSTHLTFAQFLTGGLRDQVGATESTDPAVAFGAGYEWNPEGEESSFAARFQIEYVVSSGADFPRASAGLVYRFRKSQ